jgi:hypothetical protein
MRQIKFRIWDKQRKGWLSPDDSSLHCQSNWFIDPFTGKVVDVVAMPDNQYSIDEDPEFYMDGTKITKEPRFVSQQFTGIFDKNNEGIYEGDIVKTIYDSYNIGEIKYDVYTGAYKIISNKIAVPIVTYRYDGQSFVGLVHVVDIILGNIFETPELLQS